MIRNFKTFKEAQEKYDEYLKQLNYAIENAKVFEQPRVPDRLTVDPTIPKFILTDEDLNRMYAGQSSMQLATQKLLEYTNGDNAKKIIDKLLFMGPHYIDKFNKSFNAMITGLKKKKDHLTSDEFIEYVIRYISEMKEEDIKTTKKAEFELKLRQARNKLRDQVSKLIQAQERAKLENKSADKIKSIMKIRVAKQKLLREKEELLRQSFINLFNEPEEPEVLPNATFVPDPIGEEMGQALTPEQIQRQDENTFIYNSLEEIQRIQPDLSEQEMEELKNVIKYDHNKILEGRIQRGEVPKDMEEKIKIIIDDIINEGYDNLSTRYKRLFDLYLNGELNTLQKSIKAEKQAKEILIEKTTKEIDGSSLAGLINSKKIEFRKPTGGEKKKGDPGILIYDPSISKKKERWIPLTGENLAKVANITEKEANKILSEGDTDVDKAKNFYSNLNTENAIYGQGLKNNITSKMHKPIITIGNGLKKQKLIFGKGHEETNDDLAIKIKFRKKYNNPIKWGLFGNFRINLTNLIKNILTVQYAYNKHNVNQIPSTMISEDLKNIILDILDSDKFSETVIKYLSKDEKKLLFKLLKYSGLYENLNIKTLFFDDKEDLNRFEIVKGEIIAGNDNDNLKKELRRYIFDFMKEGRIPKNEAQNLLTLL